MDTAVTPRTVAVPMGEDKPSITVTLQDVASSQLHAIGHDPATNTLVIEFARKHDGVAQGSIYAYENVDAELFDRFRHAESAGSFFYREIKPQPTVFRYRKISDQKLAQHS